MNRILAISAFVLVVHHSFAQVGFLEPVRLPFTTEATNAELADVDGDGDLDVVFVTGVYPQVRVVYNDPKGTFSKSEIVYQGPTIDLSLRPISFVVTDFNGDGVKDIVLTELGSTPLNTVTNIAAYVWQEGKFVRKQALSATALEFPTSYLGTADFNRDSKPDFIVTLPGGIVEFESGGNGYQRKNIEIADMSISNSRVADIDGDTYPDLVVFGAVSKIAILKGNAQGILAFSKFITTSGNVFDLAVGDLDGNTRMEIVAISGSSNPIDFFTQAPDGSFTGSTIARTLTDSRTIAIRDVDNDGDNDILLNGNSTNGNTRTGFSVFIHDGVNFTEHFRSLVGGSTISFAVGNVDSDAKLELLPLNTHGFVGFFKETTAGNFTQSLTFRYQPRPDGGIIADFTNDGINDLAVPSTSDMSVAIYPGTGAVGIFGEPKFYPTPLPTRSLLTADFNEDGHPDILYSLDQWDFIPTQFQQGIGVLLSGADGTIQTDSGILPSSLTSDNVAIGDFNKDGHRDILNSDAIYFGNGDGTFQYNALGLNATESQVADFNNDGNDDLVLLKSGSPSTIAIKLGKLNKTFDDGISQNLTHNDFRILVADFDGDHVPEFVTHSNVTFSILKKGAGSTYTETTIESSTLLTRLRVADIDGDGDVDLLVFKASGLDPTLTIYYNQAGVLTAGTPVPLPFVGHQNFVIGKINSDPLNDIAFSSPGTPIYVLKNDGAIEPTINPSNIAVSELSESSAKVTVTAGNGQRRIFVIAEGNVESPVDNTAYTANSKFGLGSKIGSNTFVVGNTDQVSLVITGLKKKTSYQVAVFEFNQNEQQLKQNYLIPASPTKTTFTTKDEQIITFTISTKVEGDPDFNLVGTTTSSLPLTYEVVSGNVVLTGNTVKINGPGPAKIRASQVGNNEYGSASVDALFCVNPKKPTITVENQGSGKFQLTSSRDGNNQWLLNGEIIAGATAKTYQPAADGVYSVRVAFGDCSATSDPTASLITGLDSEIPNFSVFPNPATDWLFVSSSAHTNQPVAIVDMKGRIHSPEVRSSTTQIEVDIRDLSEGLYVLKVGQFAVRFLKRTR